MCVCVWCACVLEERLLSTRAGFRLAARAAACVAALSRVVIGGKHPFRELQEKHVHESRNKTEMVVVNPCFDSGEVPLQLPRSAVVTLFRNRSVTFPVFKPSRGLSRQLVQPCLLPETCHAIGLGQSNLSNRIVRACSNVPGGVGRHMMCLLRCDARYSRSQI